MSRYQSNVTLTPDQEKYLRENYNTMTGTEISRKLNVHIGKLMNNVRVMGIEKRAAAPPFKLPTRNGFFDETKYAKIALI